MPYSNFTSKDFYAHNFVGYVVDNNDPLCIGRCRCKVYGLTDSDEIPVEHTPWFYPFTYNIQSVGGGGNISVPKIGNIVRCRFANNDIYSGEYFALQNLDPEVSNFLSDDYDGAHVLLFDSGENLNISYKRNTGLLLTLKNSYININPSGVITLTTFDENNNANTIQVTNNSINIATTNKINITGSSSVDIVSSGTVNVNASEVELGSRTIKESFVGGESLKQLLLSLASQIDAKLAPSPGVAVGLVTSGFEQIINRNVKG